MKAQTGRAAHERRLRASRARLREGALAIALAALLIAESRGRLAKLSGVAARRPGRS